MKTITSRIKNYSYTKKTLTFTIEIDKVLINAIAQNGVAQNLIDVEYPLADQKIKISGDFKNDVFEVSKIELIFSAMAWNPDAEKEIQKEEILTAPEISAPLTVHGIEIKKEAKKEKSKITTLGLHNYRQLNPKKFYSVFKLASKNNRRFIDAVYINAENQKAAITNGKALLVLNLNNEEKDAFPESAYLRQNSFTLKKDADFYFPPYEKIEFKKADIEINITDLNDYIKQIKLIKSQLEKKENNITSLSFGTYSRRYDLKNYLNTLETIKNLRGNLKNITIQYNHEDALLKLNHAECYAFIMAIS